MQSASTAAGGQGQAMGQARAARCGRAPRAPRTLPPLPSLAACTCRPAIAAGRRSLSPLRRAAAAALPGAAAAAAAAAVPAAAAGPPPLDALWALADAAAAGGDGGGGLLQLGGVLGIAVGGAFVALWGLERGNAAAWGAEADAARAALAERDARIAELEAQLAAERKVGEGAWGGATSVDSPSPVQVRGSWPGASRPPRGRPTPADPPPARPPTTPPARTPARLRAPQQARQEAEGLEARLGEASKNIMKLEKALEIKVGLGGKGAGGTPRQRREAPLWPWAVAPLLTKARRAPRRARPLAAGRAARHCGGALTPGLAPPLHRPAPSPPTLPHAHAHTRAPRTASWTFSCPPRGGRSRRWRRTSRSCRHCPSDGRRGAAAPGTPPPALG
jgi:hypothetical protein